MTPRRWQLQEAKNKLSEVVRRACDEGPQEITVRGEPAVVVVSAAEWAKLAPPGKKKKTVYEWLYDPTLPKLTEAEMAYFLDQPELPDRPPPDFGE